MIHRSFLSGIKLAHRRVQRCSMAELQSTTSPVALPAEVPELSSSIQSLATILPAEKTFASSVSHSRKRSPGPDLTVPDRRKSKKRRNDQPNEIHLEHLPDTRYYFEHGLRKVEPYHYTWYGWKCFFDTPLIAGSRLCDTRLFMLWHVDWSLDWLEW